MFAGKEAVEKAFQGVQDGVALMEALGDSALASVARYQQAGRAFGEALNGARSAGDLFNAQAEYAQTCSQVTQDAVLDITNRTRQTLSGYFGSLNAVQGSSAAPEGEEAEATPAPVAEAKAAPQPAVEKPAPDKAPEPAAKKAAPKARRTRRTSAAKAPVKAPAAPAAAPSPKAEPEVAAPAKPLSDEASVPTLTAVAKPAEPAAPAKVEAVAAPVAAPESKPAAAPVDKVEKLEAPVAADKIDERGDA